MSTLDELQLTKKRLQNLRRRSLGLEQLAVREISKQLTFYRTHPDELEKLKNLPDILREKILQDLMKKRCLDGKGQKVEFKNLKVIFPLLLSPRTHFIELNGILSFSPGRCIESKFEKAAQWCFELLKQIGTRAPQVETLIIQRNNPFYQCFYAHDEDSYDLYQEMVQSLMKMKNLNRLKANMNIFHLTDLLKICKNLSRLQYINVGMIFYENDDKPAIEEVSSSFCNLKELIFECPADGKDWLGCLCTRNLPNLQVLQYDPNENWSDTRRYDRRYQGLHFSGVSNLRNVYVDLDEYSAEEVEAMPTLFPKVSCLVVENAGNFGENVIPKFENIRQLQMLDPFGSGIIEKYLINYGQKLQSLYVGHDQDIITIDLELIFKHCPKLEKLSIRNTHLKTPPSKIEFFAELKELELVLVITYYDEIHDPESMVLSTILAAPKLEKVKLELKIFNQDDLRKLNSLIREKRILNNLHTLHVYYYFQIPVVFANLLKSACAFLPKLTDFKYGHILQLKLEEDPLLASQSSPLGHIDAGVFKISWCF